MNTTLAKTLSWEKDHNSLDLDIHDLVQSASFVIAPLGPINTFAARNPWVGLETQPFEKVARRLKETCYVEMYPNEALIKAAWDRGDINEAFLQTSLKRWLNSQNLDLPQGAAEEYCRSVLLQENTDNDQLSLSELKNITRKLSRFQPIIMKKNTVRTYSQLLKMEQQLNHHMIKWCKLYLDQSQAVWSMPHREEGFYHAWRELITYDTALDKSVRKQLNELPEEPDYALMLALSALEISPSDIQEYLEAHLLALPGWAGMMLWRSQNSIREHSLLMDYLAVRISVEEILIRPYLPLTEEKNGKLDLEELIVMWANYGNLPTQQWAEMSVSEQKARLTLAWRFDKILRNRLWLEAWEKTYEEKLRRMITSNLQTKEAASLKSALAQFVLCIDVRSEPFRRLLETAGSFETIGTAGFFGLPIEACELGSHHRHNSLPVMFKPQFTIKESLPEVELKNYLQRQHAASSPGVAFASMKHNLIVSLVLPEISGPWLSLQTLARSFVPRGAGFVFRKLRKSLLHKPSAKLTLDHQHTYGEELPVGFTEKEKVQFVQNALKMMGLTDHFSPLVVICGHGSISTNNPYKAALDCGACGGISSGFNARVLSSLCNLPEVRENLAAEGIMIPQETIFVAAEHVTTIDELRWLYVPELTDAAQQAFDQIQEVLSIVSEKANAERVRKLPNYKSANKNLKAEAHLMSEDWSEVRPEWGLARNAAFIIGDRRLTKECNLEGRVFLQNYSWRKDKNGNWLKNIIDGPGTVAEWINLQYYASTVAPHYYGSGNKATQTLTAGLGVMQGNASDLLPGLPWQSVMKSDQEAYHDPLRLLVVIQAPKDHVKRLLDNNPSFFQKVQNGWIRLASIGPEGSWESWS